MRITNQLDKVNSVPQESGKYSPRSVIMDMERLIIQLYSDKGI